MKLNDDLNQPTPDPQAPKGLGAAFQKFTEVFNEALKTPQPRPKPQVLITPDYNAPISGIPSEQPTKFCDVCGVIMEMKITREDCALRSGTCARCQQQLDEGAIALMSPDRRFAFVHSKTLADSASEGEHTQRVKISNEVMDKVQERFKEQQSAV